MDQPQKSQEWKGIALALLAVVIWSGNFIVARSVKQQIGPVSLAFFRWLTATLLILPLAWKRFQQEKQYIRQHLPYLFWVALSGITIFNTCVYVAGHYTSAINLALIGTTSSPIFATLLAWIFLKEQPAWNRGLGLIICIGGILLLLSKGSWQVLAGFHFGKGDLWVIAGAFAFAVYSTLVRKKPATISPLHFLFLVFGIGTACLLPAFLIEMTTAAPAEWNFSLFSIILYLGAGASVISFLSWNESIRYIGAGRTVLFGNLIPVFSTMEAVWLLGEKMSMLHLISGLIVIAGLMLANMRLQKK
jgi:drug/metabolite transporter (DMT)-like permease